MSAPFAPKFALAPGETERWAARPDERHFARWRPRLISLGLFWTLVAGAGFYGFSVTLLSPEYDGLALGARIAILVLCALPFVAVAVFALGGHVILMRRAACRTLYVLTDRRCLLQAPLFVIFGPVRTRELAHDDIGTVQCELHDRGVGTLEIHSRTGAADPLRLRSLPDATSRKTQLEERMRASSSA